MNGSFIKLSILGYLKAHHRIGISAPSAVKQQFAEVTKILIALPLLIVGEIIDAQTVELTMEEEKTAHKFK